MKPDGEQCKRNRPQDADYCWMHGPMVQRNLEASAHLDASARFIEDNIPSADLSMALRDDAERKAMELVPQLFRSINPHFVEITTEVLEDEVVIKYKRKSNNRIAELWRDGDNEALRQSADDLLAEIEDREAVSE